ncbi:MAG: rRNA pseudouridine synthase [Deltaproteobacteria bacterium]|nr:rRNA pseudouridine synthase [Deltaproteobacteria bacterium]
MSSSFIKRNRESSRFSGGYVSLNRALSKLGVASRKTACQAIESGEVQVNGKIILDTEYLVIPEKSTIVFRGATVTKKSVRVILFHKPRCVMTTRTDPENRPTVYSFFENELPGFHAVGRLDYHTSGLLLFTNDTQLSNRLLDPSRQIPRTYVATVRGRVDSADAPLFTRGVVDNGEHLFASHVTASKTSNRESRLIIELRGGKNREIRRLCKLLHHEVLRLKRISFGNFKLGDLAPGQYREATREELAACRQGQYGH